MNRHRFDGLTRSLFPRPSRRHLFAGLAGSVFASSRFRFPEVVSAKNKRKKRKHKKKKKVAFNEFGCVNVGSFCQTNDQCCSGICQGKKDKQTCQAHDASTCQGQDVCINELEPVLCTATTGDAGTCYVTTGNASYCAASTRCFACATDADCVPVCGPGAACVACAGADCLAVGLRTACAGAIDNSCITVISTRGASD